MLTRRVIAALAVTALLVAPGYSKADILWDQAPDPDALAFVDQRFSDFPEFSTFLVNDVVFNTQVNVDSISVYFTDINQSWPAAGTATLNVFLNDGTLDTEDPLAGTQVAINLIDTADGLTVVASGLNLNLAAGTYWIGLTPNFDFGQFNQEFHQQTSGIIGSETWARNPGGGFGLGGDWQTGGTLFGQPPFDSALRVEGSVVPEPTAVGVLALGIVGLVIRRRR
jgi:hypothetical protein